jgi:hypothetical protein
MSNSQDKEERGRSEPDKYNRIVIILKMTKLPV